MSWRGHAKCRHRLHVHVAFVVVIFPHISISRRDNGCLCDFDVGRDIQCHAPIGVLWRGGNTTYTLSYSPPTIVARHIIHQRGTNIISASLGNGGEGQSANLGNGEEGQRQEAT
jgi:hypothetical protein